MVFGAAGGKLFPILFGLYLSRTFGQFDFSSFILIITYAAALTAVASMGSAPQLLRLGAVEEPEKHVITVVSVGVLLTVVLVALSSFFWSVISTKPLLAQGEWLGLFLLGEMALGLICYSISQAILNAKSRFRVAGFSSLVTYAGSAVLGMMAGYLFNSNTYALVTYFTFFLGASLVFLVLSQRAYIKAWQSFQTLINLKDLITGAKIAMHTSLFGVVTLVGFFIIMAIVHARLSVQDSAVFAMSFQLFQAGIFLPSVLGSIAVPRMVSASKVSDINREKAVHKKIRALYLLIGVGWTGLVALFAYPLLSLYALSESKESVYAIILFQVAGIFAVMQAYHIQKSISLGNFGLLAVAAVVWLAVALFFIEYVGQGLLAAVLALVAAYTISFLFYEGLSWLSPNERNSN